MYLLNIWNAGILDLKFVILSIIVKGAIQVHGDAWLYNAPNNGQGANPVFY